MKIICRLLLVFITLNLYSCGDVSRKQDNASNIALKQNLSSKITDIIASEVKTRPLNKEEMRIMKKVCKQYSEIKMTNALLACNDKQSDEHVLYYEKDSSYLYFGEYVEYSVSLKNEPIIFQWDYTYSAGKAFSATGQIVYNKITDDMIRIEYNYGTGVGSLEIDVNEKNIFKKNNEF